MLNNLQATLYETFGYLLPGSVFLLGMAILFWAIYLPRMPFVPVELSLQWQLVLILLAYFVGHLNQALANLLAKLLPSSETIALSKGFPGSLPDDLIKVVRLKVSEMLGVELKDISPEWLFRICDETLLQRGNCSDREIYQYREGFYRGLTLSFLGLAISLTVRAIIPGAALQIIRAVQPISIAELLFFIILALLGSWLTFRRYRRFGIYRVTHAIIGFLALQEQVKHENKRGVKHA